MKLKIAIAFKGGKFIIELINECHYIRTSLCMIYVIFLHKIRHPNSEMMLYHYHDISSWFGRIFARPYFMWHVVSCQINECFKQFALFTLFLGKWTLTSHSLEVTKNMTRNGLFFKINAWGTENFKFVSMKSLCLHFCPLKFNNNILSFKLIFFTPW